MLNDDLTFKTLNYIHNYFIDLFRYHYLLIFNVVRLRKEKAVGSTLLRVPIKSMNYM